MTRREQALLVAESFHETYESLAPSYGYKTREASAVPWSEVPQPNRMLMVAVAMALLETGVIAVPEVSLDGGPDPLGPEPAQK